MAYYDTIRLEKGMYHVAGKSFTQVLEELDPSAGYRGSALDGLDAFERQLKRFDIKVSGAHSDTVEKFYATATSASLFPEYVKRIVTAGMHDGAILGKITASQTKIDAMDYRSITAGIDSSTLDAVSEGDVIPSTTIQVQENLVKLHKKGRMIMASYEALRFQRLDLFGVTLRQIGNRIAKAQLEDAVNVLISGDGNSNPAENIALLGGTFSYQDLINLWSKFEDHEMNTMLVDSDAMMKLLSLDEFKNPNTGLNFAATGKLTTPIGATLYKTGVVPQGSLVVLDSRSSLEFVTVGDVSIEYDKLIDRQMERAAITSIYGFAKIFPDAVKTMDIA